ncbi:MAG: cation:proton antiporter domain-containing protein, partial [Candidatus Thorarchaeota archaeon]
MDTVTSVLLLISATLFLSYLSGLIYTKTRIPDIVWLMALGYLLGPILGFFQPDILSPESFNLLILITVAIFSFDTGINVSFTGAMKKAGKALILSGASFLVIMIVVGYSMHFVLPNKFTLSEGMLLGAMIGGLGGISVTGILSRLSALIPNVKKDGVLINLESTLSDPIRLVAVVVIIGIITQDTMTLESGIKDIVFVLVIATLFGLTAGMLWAEVLSLLWNRPFNYMMTVAALFPIYILSENYIGEGGGPLTALAFGMAITNYTEIAKRFGYKRKVKIQKAKIREFNLE